MRLLRVSLALFTITLSALTGCREEEPIKRETVTTPDREKLSLRVAVLERPSRVWFVRFSGPSDLVKEHQATFDALVRSIKLESGKRPTWTDPKDWTKDPPSTGGMIERMASYRLKGKKELEIVITRDHRDKKYDLMANMHRWQKQVNVPLTEEHKVLDEQIKREKVNGMEVKWVVLDGLGVHTVSKPTEAVAAQKNKFAFQLQKSMLPFKYTLPKDWVRKQPPNKIVAEMLEFDDGDDLVQITFVPLPGDGGGLAPNINRWRKEIKLAELADADVEKSGKYLDIDGAKSFYVDLDNPNGPAERNQTLGAIIPVAKMTWFVKMSGPRAVVAQQKAEYETFLKSLKIEK